MQKDTIKVRVENLTKNFGDVHVLQNVSFDIKNGEFLAIVGPTGCGKTTFLNLLTKLIEPTEGTILIDSRSADPREHNLAFIFQEASALPWLTVEDNLKFGLEIKKYSKEEISARVEKIISMLGLEKYRKTYPAQLSVSTEQRVVIGRAFAMTPDLLLMDEPYGQLDIKVRYYLEDELIKLWKELKSTIVFITHDVEEAVYMADRILILSNKPSTIKEEVIIDLPRPRKLSDPKFLEIRKYITQSIKWW